jgi:cytochrome c nitrite reductase small subunit
MKIAMIASIVSLIMVLGVGMYVSDFTAYLGSNPATCNNCHVMDAAYESWYHAGHAQAAVCADCHTPHALIPKYWVKARSGFRHVTVFSFGDIPTAIRAAEASRDVIQENCIRCHAETVDAMMENPMPLDRYCFECHRTVAHGDRGITTQPLEENSQ